MLELGLERIENSLGARCDLMCGHVTDNGKVGLVVGSRLKAGCGF